MEGEHAVRKVVWQMMFTLDGFMAGPKGALDWHVIDDDFKKYVADMPKRIDTFIFGRVTYELMADFWPSSNEPEAPMMNTFPKLVFSRTLKETPWNRSRLATKSVPEEVARLKGEPGKDIALLGSSDLASTFIRHGLIDEYRLLLNPLARGAGLPLFQGLEKPLFLRLEKAQTFASGVVALTYTPETKK